MIIVKVGGGAEINIRGVADDLAQLDGPMVVVHGANALRNRLAADLGIKIQTVTALSGQSSVLSDERVIELAMLAYAGLANKRLVELLQQRGVNAVGLSGLDGRIVQARRNPGIRTRRGDKLVLVRDHSGRAHDVNGELLQLLLDNGYTPVLTMPLVDGDGHAVNSENDDVVAALHRNLGAERILFLVEAAGMLEDASNPDSKIDALDRAQLEALQTTVNGRMGRKLRSIASLLDHGAPHITISDGRSEHPVRDALNGCGTVVQ